eukprot:3795769-Amphidinium_carterae.1
MSQDLVSKGFVCFLTSGNSLGSSYNSYSRCPVAETMDACMIPSNPHTIQFVVSAFPVSPPMCFGCPCPSDLGQVLPLRLLP